MAKERILFIDDDNFLRKVYQAELSERGFDVVLAVDGDDGIAKAIETKPKLIILDLIMPKKNGFEVIADLQRNPDTRMIPVIVLSNLAQSDDQKHALDLGAVDYLVKDNTTLEIIAEKIDYYIRAVPKLKSTTSVPTPSAAPKVKEQKAPIEKPLPQPSITVQTSPVAGSAVKHNFCPQCGFKLSEGAKFCPNCGTKQV